MNNRTIDLDEYKIPAIPNLELIRNVLEKSKLVDDDGVVKKLIKDLAFQVYRREEFLGD